MRRSRGFLILFAAALLLHGAALLWSLAIAFEAISPTISVGDTLAFDA